MLRGRQTPAERMLWRHLKRVRMEHRWVRQQPMAGYVLDFYCASAKLAVELDGGSHIGRRGYDAARDLALEQLGIKTIRVGNGAAFKGMALGLLLRDIWRAMKDRVA